VVEIAKAAALASRKAKAGNGETAEANPSEEVGNRAGVGAGGGGGIEKRKAEELETGETDAAGGEAVGDEEEDRAIKQAKV
jgi:hypothetical protein